jgi:hypothetical protein
MYGRGVAQKSRLPRNLRLTEGLACPSCGGALDGLAMRLGNHRPREAPVNGGSLMEGKDVVVAGLAMSRKPRAIMKIKIVAATIALALAGALPASAAKVQYTFSGLGSGFYTDGATTTPFSNLSFTIKSTEGVATPFNDPGVSFGIEVPVEGAEMSIPALGYTNAALPNADSNYVLFFGGSDSGTAAVGAPPFSGPALFYSAAFEDYDGVSNLGPASFSYSDQLGSLDPTFANGADVNFTSISDGVFTAAAVPEPATWLMMLLGAGGVGCAARGRRRMAAATA